MEIATETVTGESEVKAEEGTPPKTTKPVEQEKPAPEVEPEKPAPKPPRANPAGKKKAPPTKKERPKMAAKKSEKTNGKGGKVGTAVTPEVMKGVRKLQAQMQLESGEKVSISDAIGKAVEAALD